MEGKVIKSSTDSKKKVLVLGVYLVDHPNNAVKITNEMMSSEDWEVTIGWVSLGLQQPIPELLEFTLLRKISPVDKFSALNELISSFQLDPFEYLILVDDDIDIGPGWLDLYLRTQELSSLSVAQPARTSDSFLDHHSTKEAPGIRARKTNFVEIGPVVSIKQEVLGLLYPFTEDWPMGWGLDYEWSRVLKNADVQIGVIDTAPVRHKMRTPQKTYSSAQARLKMRALLNSRNYTDADCQKSTFETLTKKGWSTSQKPKVKAPKISAVISTLNRSQLLEGALDSLAIQTLDPCEYEVLVIDDGSVDETANVVTLLEKNANVRYAFQEQSGIAAARNHGLNLAGGNIVIFLDDDDVASPTLLEAHLVAHEKWATRSIGILGKTELSPRLSNSFLMRYMVTEGRLFSYPTVPLDSEIPYHYFWGGRSSINRNFMIENGVFDPSFRFGYEDTELAYRLEKCGFAMRYEPSAISSLVRPMSLEDFTRRTIKQGLSLKRFYLKYEDPDLISPYKLNADSHPVLINDQVALLTRHTEKLLQIADGELGLNLPLHSFFTEELTSLLDFLYHHFMTVGFAQFDPLSDGQKELTL